MTATVTDKQLDNEFAYVSWGDSCRDLHSLHYRCRRPKRHDGVHAAGFGKQRIRWENQDNPDVPPETLSS